MGERRTKVTEKVEAKGAESIKSLFMENAEALEKQEGLPPHKSTEPNDFPQERISICNYEALQIILAAEKYESKGPCNCPEWGLTVAQEYDPLYIWVTSKLQ